MNENPQATFERLCTFAESKMKEKGVPGVALGLLCGEDTYTAGFGVTSIDHPLPVTADTLFQIGSISKTFTCLALMRLVEAEKIDLCAPVREYLPEFSVAEEVASVDTTIWHLLTHTGGWVGDHFIDTGAGDDALPKYVAQMADLEQLAPLGKVFSYNNAGFYLAGALIEQVTRQRYEAAMQELVFAPLGLDRCFFEAGEVLTHRFAVGHRTEGASAQVARPWPLPRAARPAGGIVCDVGQLLRYARFQMGTGTAEDGESLLQPDTLAQMHTPQVSRWGEAEQIGLSWFIDEVGGVRQLSHGGGTVGQVSLLALYPAHNLALVVLTNADEGGDVTGAVRRWVLEHCLEIEDPEPEPIDASEQELSAYAGSYSRPFADIELGMLGGRLIGQAIYKQGFPSPDVPPPPPPPPVSLALYAEDRLLITGGPMSGGRADVIRKDDGSIGWLRLGRVYRRIET